MLFFVLKNGMIIYLLRIILVLIEEYKEWNSKFYRKKFNFLLVEL